MRLALWLLVATMGLGCGKKREREDVPAAPAAPAAPTADAAVKADGAPAGPIPAPDIEVPEPILE